MTSGRDEYMASNDREVENTMTTLETKKLFEFLKQNYKDVPENAYGFTIWGGIGKPLDIEWKVYPKLKDKNASS